MSTIRFKPRAAAALALAVGLALAPAVAEAKAGGGFSFGSRGTRTFTPPPVTNTAPRQAAPMERSATPQILPNSGFGQRTAAPVGGLFGGGFGRGLLGGFIGAGLFGLLFGHGLFGGLGGIMSLFGLLLQLALVYLIARLAWNWFQNRQPALSGAAFRQGSSSMGFGGAPRPTGGFGSPPPRGAPLKIDPADFNMFERRLSEIQTAYGAEDRATLTRLATPEMVRYFDEQFAENARKGLVNRVSGATLLQGDLSEAWREYDADYASVAMRFSVLDTMVERSSGRIVSGNATVPQESTEVWTFTRPLGAGVDGWSLAAIQQA
jgi:predicted lipid-binding transport protein (Tim44 family)